MKHGRLWRTLLLAQWRDSPARIVATVLAIALGVALASAVYLVNRGALDEFEQAARRLAGEADFTVRGPRTGFAETLYRELARTDGVAVASPMLALDVVMPGERQTLPVLALDPFRATQVQPGLLGEIAGSLRGFFEPDGIFLSASAAAALEVGTGDRFEVLAGTMTRRLRVLGLLSESAYPRPLGIMDIAAAQWMFGRLGVLNRIDVRLTEGADGAAVRAAIAAQLPAGVTVTVPGIDSQRIATATRAYRVNLNMLALVALLTGAFLVLATQALSILRRRVSFGLLRAIGVTRSQLQGALIGEGVVLGAVGACVGVALGQLAAAWILRVLAGDLGGGQLTGVVGSLSPQPFAWVAFVVIGALVAGIAAWLPAREAAARSPALALKAGDAEAGLGKARPFPAGVSLLAFGTLLAFLPAVRGVPVFGYCAVAAMLLGGVLLVPAVAQRVLAAWPPMRGAPAMLAVAQLRGSTAQASIGLAAIVVSFSLMVAMAIMVHSFRESFVSWLDTVLPADMQLRLGQGGDTAAIGVDGQAALSRIDGVARASFRRVLSVSLAPATLPVALIAAEIDEARAAEMLALVRSAAAGAPDTLPRAWISEPIVDLHGWQPGERVTLPLAGREVAFRIAGVFRDYGRSAGTIVMSRQVYVDATGDTSASDASFWLVGDADPAAVEAAMRALLPFGAALQIRTTTEVRRLSLANFDRAFAITYALEAIAVLIGLLGVSFTAASTALARRGEFGMLRHVGLLRRQVVAMLAGEGLLTSAIGVSCALALGGLLSLVLVFVINRQSFLWSIDLSIPWLQLVVLTVALVLAAAVTATLSGRGAVSRDAVRAVREDW